MRDKAHLFVPLPVFTAKFRVMRPRDRFDVIVEVVAIDRDDTLSIGHLGVPELTVIFEARIFAAIVQRVAYATCLAGNRKYALSLARPVPGQVDPDTIEVGVARQQMMRVVVFTLVIPRIAVGYQIAFAIVHIQREHFRLMTDSAILKGGIVAHDALEQSCIGIDKTQFKLGAIRERSKVCLPIGERQRTTIALTLLDETIVNRAGTRGITDALIALHAAIQIRQGVAVSLRMRQRHAFTCQEALLADGNRFKRQRAIQAIDKYQPRHTLLETHVVGRTPAGAELTVIQRVDARAVIACPLDIDQPRHAEVGLPQVLIAHRVIDGVAAESRIGRQTTGTARGSIAGLTSIGSGLACLSTALAVIAPACSGLSLMIHTARLVALGDQGTGQSDEHRHQIIDGNHDHLVRDTLQLAQGHQQSLTLIFSKPIYQCIECLQ